MACLHETVHTSLRTCIATVQCHAACCMHRTNTDCNACLHFIDISVVPTTILHQAPNPRKDTACCASLPTPQNCQNCPQYSSPCCQILSMLARIAAPVQYAQGGQPHGLYTKYKRPTQTLLQSTQQLIKDLWHFQRLYLSDEGRPLLLLGAHTHCRALLALAQALAG